MMDFVSTRGGGPVSFARALQDGLAPDGGLYVPARVSAVLMAPPPLADDADPVAALRQTAIWTLRHVLDAPDAGWLEGVVDDAFTFPVPLSPMREGRWLLELYHGPTLAFKDVGARFLARALQALSPKGVPRTVLVATSGDTGGAVAHAFHGVEGVQVVVLFPRGGVSEIQRRQMTTLAGNVTAVAVDGTFDDCQRLAKEAFADAELSQAVGLTSANSINVGRLLPQAVYYVHAARLLGWDAAPATFVVPSGNLGNLCAGLMAHRAGMPAAGFVAATNRNRTFPDYLESGRYEARPSVTTPSNAMDVGAPSNIERIRWLVPERERLAHLVRGGWCGDAETRQAMARAHRETGVVLDPHAAVGWCVAERTVHDPGAPMVLLGTAHPAKFAEEVSAAVGEIPAPPALVSLILGDEAMVFMDADLSALRTLLMETPR